MTTLQAVWAGRGDGRCGSRDGRGQPPRRAGTPNRLRTHSTHRRVRCCHAQIEAHYWPAWQVVTQLIDPSMRRPPPGSAGSPSSACRCRWRRRTVSLHQGGVHCIHRAALRLWQARAILVASIAGSKLMAPAAPVSNPTVAPTQLQLWSAGGVSQFRSEWCLLPPSKLQTRCGDHCSICHRSVHVPDSGSLPRSLGGDCSRDWRRCQCAETLAAPPVAHTISYLAH